jgi:hypothetical protein
MKKFSLLLLLACLCAPNYVSAGKRKDKKMPLNKFQAQAGQSANTVRAEDQDPSEPQEQAPTRPSSSSDASVAPTEEQQESAQSSAAAPTTQSTVKEEDISSDWDQFGYPSTYVSQNEEKEQGASWLTTSFSAKSTRSKQTANQLIHSFNQLNRRLSASEISVERNRAEAALNELFAALGEYDKRECADIQDQITLAQKKAALAQKATTILQLADKLGLDVNKQLIVEANEWSDKNTKSINKLQEAFNAITGELVGAQDGLHSDDRTIARLLGTFKRVKSNSFRQGPTAGQNTADVITLTQLLAERVKDNPAHQAQVKMLLGLYSSKKVPAQYTSLVALGKALRAVEQKIDEDALQEVQSSAQDVNALSELESAINELIKSQREVTESCMISEDPQENPAPFLTQVAELFDQQN